MNSQPKNSQNQLLTSQAHKPLGEILIEAGLVTANQIEIALQEQKECGLKIGELLALKGFIKQKTADFFVEQWPEILKAKTKKPLVVYFVKAGLLDKQQVKSLLYRQKQHPQKIRFHRLVIQEGYLKAITVDYFLANIFHIYSSNIFSFTKPYEVIKSYTEGKTDFKRSQLIQAPLKGVTLKNVELDNSNLQGADLENCNLSNSSLQQVNLTRANLYKAILTAANFEGASLKQADLRESYLEEANFGSANLQEADLSNAYLLKAVFSHTDLRGAKLPSESPYDIYYNKQTLFDSNFDPIAAGWIEQDSET